MPTVEEVSPLTSDGKQCLTSRAPTPGRFSKQLSSITRYSTSESEIPPIVVQILLFIENRAMLDPRYPSRNPAIELTPKRLP